MFIGNECDRAITVLVAIYSKLMRIRFIQAVRCYGSLLLLLLLFFFFFHYLKSHLSSIQSMNRSNNLLMKIMGLMEKIIPGFSFWTQILFSDIVWEKFERSAVRFSHRRKREKKKKKKRTALNPCLFSYSFRQMVEF